MPRAIEDGLREILRDHARAIAEDYPKHWRQAGGYRLDRLAREWDLAKFVTGSEGTLVAISEATVRLVELPKATMFAVGHFDSLEGAIAATGDALELGPTTVEMIDRTILGLSRSKLEYRKLSETLQGDPEALLFVSFAGGSDDEVRDKLDRLARAWEQHGHGYHTLRAETAAEQDALTKVRKAGLGLLMAASEGASRPAAFVEDTAVAPERLNDYVARFREVLDRHELKAGFYGHCSVGCLHIRPFVDLTAPGGVETMETVAGEIASLVAEFDGVNSSEHGDGRVRSPFSPQVFGPDLYEAMRKVKRLFDPAGRLNPGIMVDAAPITVNLRDPALPPPGPIDTHFHFEGGMRAAADRCQRIGVCRKTGSGVMCPSYMATREEEHATRGRANALVKALSSPDPRKAMGDERLHEILDLCLECKACKSECPLSVDMATMKSEFLSQYQAQHGTPLRSKLFGAIRPLNRLGAATAPLSNLPGRIPVARRLLERTVGIARQRPLPRFHREHLVRWDKRRTRTAPNGTPRGRLPGRLVHDLLRAGHRPRRHRAARGRRLPRAAGERRLLRALLDLQGPARPGARHGRRDGRPPGARRGARGADRRLRAVVPADAARGAPAAAAGRPARAGRREAGQAGRGAARRGDRRRLAAARSGRAGGEPADRLPRPLPPEGAGRDGGHRGAAEAHPGRRGHRARRGLLRNGRFVRLRGRALRTLDGNRGVTAVPGAAGSRAGHVGGGDRGVVPSADRPWRGTAGVASR